MTGPSIVIGSAATHLPDGVEPLAERARAEGIGIIDRVVTDWRDGTEPFERPGEVLLVATVASAADDADDGTIGRALVVAIGGLTVCPTVDGAMRVRRFYVDPDHRRLGLGRRLATRLLAQAADHSDLVTCNAGASDAAAPFWESLGFVRVDRAGITHQRPTGRPPS